MSVEEVQKALGTHASVLKVERLIGRGSFGSVWFARDSSLGNRPVALKVLDRLNDYEGVKEYAGGVRQHPNLLQIFFCDTCAEKLFYAMELADNVEGAGEGVGEGDGGYRADTLAGRLLAHAEAGSRPALDEISAVIDGLLDGLATMHSCGYCHRDIKPENIIFVAGVPKLSDVGSVRRIEKADTSGVTPCYLPPEMCEGRYDPVGHDLYSVGMLIYCMLSLHGGEDFPLLDDIGVLQDKTCRRLNAFVTERACSDDLSRRYHDIAAFRADFDRCFYRPPVAKLVTGGIFLATVAVLGGWLWWSMTPRSDRRLHLSESVYVKSPSDAIPSMKLSISKGEIRREDLPLELVLSDVTPGTTLRIAPTDKSELPENLRDVYASWTDWGVYPCCSVLFLKGGGASVSLAVDEIKRRRNFLLSGLVAGGSSRKVVVKLVAAKANGVDLTINGHIIAEDFFKTGVDPVRLLVGVVEEKEEREVEK